MTPETRVEESVYAVLRTADALQTINIGADPQQYYERESAWAIGRHPSKRSVLLYMGSQEAAHLVIGWEADRAGVPRWLRRGFEAVTIADEANCVIGNIELGVKF